MENILLMWTLLDDYVPRVPTCDKLLSPQEITFAPEAQVPLGVFNDDKCRIFILSNHFCWTKEAR